MSSATAQTLNRTETVRRIRCVGWVGLLANLGLSAVKLVAGLIGNSTAVVADAVHSLSDVVTDVAVILGVHFWSAPADDDHPHGHGRIETLITVAIGLALAAVALGIGFDAVQSIGEPHSHPPGPIALFGALLSIVCKEWMYRWTVKVGRQARSPALVANAWHHRSDALSSLPVAVAVALSIVAPRWAAVDHVGAVVVCVFILHASWKIVRPALAELVDAAAPEDERAKIERLALAVPGVVAAHALRTRYTGARLAVDLHIEVDGGLTVREGHEIAQAVRQSLLEHGPEIADVIVQVEPASDTATR